LVVFCVRKRLWICIGIGLAIYIGWAVARGVGLRSYGAVDRNNSVAQLVSLTIEAQHPEFSGRDYAHVMVTVRNVTDGPVVVGLRHHAVPVDDLFRWNVSRGGAPAARTKGTFDRFGGGSYPDRAVFRINSAPYRAPVAPELLAPGQARSFFLDDPRWFFAMREDGEYRISLSYQFTAARTELDGRYAYLAINPAPDDPLLAQGTLTSNEITVTRRAK
jgi:hypothetical protein